MNWGNMPSKSRSLRSRRHLKPEVKQYLETAKRGRGRPRKNSNTLIEDRRLTAHRNRIKELNNESRNVTEDMIPVVTIPNQTNEEPPQLMRQNMDIDERVRSKSNTSPPEGMPSPVQIQMCSMSESGLMASRALNCSKLLQDCHELTNKIKEKGLEKESLVTALKYALLKTNLGNTELTIDTIKSAMDDMCVGASYNIENGIMTERRRTQNNNIRIGWTGGRNYTPQPDYN